MILKLLDPLADRINSNTGGKAKAKAFKQGDFYLLTVWKWALHAFEYGRGPAQSRGTGPYLSEKILGWVKSKFSFDKEYKYKGLAFVIARAINKHGTKLFQQYKGKYPGSGKISSVVNKDTINKLKSDIAKQIKKEILAA